jgi:hypothetical protein
MQDKTDSENTLRTVLGSAIPQARISHQEPAVAGLQGISVLEGASREAWNKMFPLAFRNGSLSLNHAPDLSTPLGLFISAG